MSSIGCGTKDRLHAKTPILSWSQIEPSRAYRIKTKLLLSMSNRSRERWVREAGRRAEAASLRSGLGALTQNTLYACAILRSQAIR
jgi:hypothetical protein